MVGGEHALDFGADRADLLHIRESDGDLAEFDLLAAAAAGGTGDHAAANAGIAGLERHVHVAVEILGRLAAAAATGGHPLGRDADDQVLEAAHVNRAADRVLEGEELVSDGGAEHAGVDAVVVFLLRQETAAGEFELVDIIVSRRGGDEPAVVNPGTVANFRQEDRIGTIRTIESLKVLKRSRSVNFNP